MTGLWIKVCGITTSAAVDAAHSAGVDAIGFVFADSPRRVTPGHAFRLAAPVRGRLACVAVVRQTTQSEIDEILHVFRPDVLQADMDELEQWRLPHTLEVLPVASTRQFAPDSPPTRLLLERPKADDDTDWNKAAIRNLCRQTRLILAGGLDARNVVTIVRSVEPYGVDVSRGVEIQPGIKCPDLIGQFAKAARSLDGATVL